MFAAFIKDGVVENVAKMLPGQELPRGWVQIERRVGKGWSYDGTDFAPPAKQAEREDDTPAPVRAARLLARKKLEEATGMTIAEIRLALRG